jgi:hypothetical protein
MAATNASLDAGYAAKQGVWGFGEIGLRYARHFTARII